jgi:FkbM family methyltransferase
VTGKTGIVRDPFYQAATLWKYANAIGWPAALRLRYCDCKARAGISQPHTRELKIKNSEFPVLIRTRASDRDVFGQVFVQREYEPIDLSSPKMILDLGANVGYSSAYFLSKYPATRVLAVEPDPGNYEVCCHNLAPFGTRAAVLHGAAWAERTKLALVRGTYRDGRDWSTQVKVATKTSAGSANIEAYDMCTLIGLCGVREIDLLKIDIEKSELELFSGDTAGWLPSIRNICIELHGPDCEEAFFRALAGYSYDLSRPGDLTICRNLKLLHCLPAKVT